RCTCLASKARFHKSLGHRPWDVFSVYPKLITRNSGMLPDSWRGHFVRVPAQVKNLRDTSGKMPELRPKSDLNNEPRQGRRNGSRAISVAPAGAWTNVRQAPVVCTTG